MTLKDEAEDTTLVYNWDNKLRSASYDGNSISIKYDPMGNRVLKFNNTAARKYIIDIAGGLPTILLELDPNNGMEIKRYYVYANGEVLMKYEPYDRYFYLHDRLGSVRQLLMYGWVMNSYTYGPFGEMIVTDCVETRDNPFKFTGQYYDSEIGQYYLRSRQYDLQLMRFTGREYDSETGNYYYRARYYSPKLGRFLQPDPIGYEGGLNLYSYCGNNPINWIDPYGSDFWVQGKWYGHQQICIGDPKGVYRAWGYYPAGLNFVGGKAVVRKDPPMRGSSVKRCVVKTTESEDRFLTKIMEDQVIRTHTDPTSDYRYIYGFRDCHS